MRIQLKSFAVVWIANIEDLGLLDVQRQAHSVAFDVEAVCRPAAEGEEQVHGPLSVLTFKDEASADVYMVDVLAFTDNESRRALRDALLPVLSAEGPEKLMWDLRKDSEALKRDLGLDLGRVLDLQVAYTARRWREYGVIRRKGLSSTLKTVLPDQPELPVAAQLRTSEHHIGVWERRPLEKDVLEYAAFDVLHLHSFCKALCVEQDQQLLLVARELSSKDLELYTSGQQRTDALTTLNPDWLQQAWGYTVSPGVCTYCMERSSPQGPHEPEMCIKEFGIYCPQSGCSAHFSGRLGVLHAIGLLKSHQEKEHLGKFKTQICKRYEAGDCAYGLACSFAHTDEELKQHTKQLRNNSTNAPTNFKTQLCVHFKAGRCPLGDSCNFAHGEEQIRDLNANTSDKRFKTQLCNHFSQGLCTRGDSCHFAHGEVELRDKESIITTTNFRTRICIHFSNGHCPKGDSCRFAHGEEQLRGDQDTQQPSSSYAAQAYQGHYQPVQHMQLNQNTQPPSSSYATQGYQGHYQLVQHMQLNYPGFAPYQSQGWSAGHFGPLQGQYQNLNQNFPWI